MRIRLGVGLKALALLIVTLVLLAVGSASAGSATAAESWVLRYATRAGDRARYSFDGSGRVMVEVEGLEGSMRSEMQLHMECLAEFMGTGDDGLVRVRGSVLSGAARSTSNGEVLDEVIDPMVQVYYISARGELDRTEEVEGAARTLGYFEMPGFEPDDVCLVLDVGVLPEGEIAVGGSWSGSVDIGGEEEEESVTVQYQSRLVGEGEYQGRPCVRIETDFDCPISPPTGGEGMEVRGRIYGHLEWHFDRERGVVMVMEGPLRVAFTGSFGDEEGNEFAMSMRYVMNVRSALTEFNGQRVGGG